MAPGLELVAPPPALELPAGIEPHVDVDLDADDPALLADGRRSCITASRAGTRCKATPKRGELLCNVHAGRLDPAAGGHALAAKRRLDAERVEKAELEARLGTRAIVAAALREKAPQIRLAIGQLADRAADGDRACALALIPWLNQGLGMPAPTDHAPLVVEGEELDLSTLDTASLRALLGR
jgi:hypothetical protein